MKTEEMNEKIDETIRAIKSSYGSKYTEKDFEEFRVTAREKAKSLKHLVSLVENMFDLDRSDAHDMVNQLLYVFREFFEKKQ